MGRVIFLLTLPVLYTSILIVPIIWDWSVIHWRNWLLVLLAVTFWSAKAIWEYKP